MRTSDQPANYRVRRALTRLSRDRWLSGREVRDIAIRLARCCSGNPAWTADHSYPMPCSVIGMLRGMPPAWTLDDDYRDFVHALRDLKCRKPFDGELLILKLTLKRNANGRQPIDDLRRRAPHDH